MVSILEFLEARIEEDEARAGSGWTSLRDSRWETDNYGRNFLTPSAVLAECAAKRAMLELQGAYTGDYDGSGNYVKIVELMAAVYKDHPDYQQEWAA